MGDLDSIRNDFLNKRPEDWDKLPDLDLYMDQVISLLNRTQLAPAGSQKLTAAMINNYVKEGLLPRAKGKRYDRDHVALLHLFVALKEVVTVKDAGTLLSLYIDENNIMGGYNALSALLGDKLDETIAVLPAEEADDLLAEAAIGCALSAYAQKMACLRLLDVLSRRNEDVAATADATDRKKSEKASAKKKQAGG